MIARRPPRCRRVETVGFAVVGLALAFGGPASAQHTPDPYNIVGEYNRQYEPYMYAVAPDNDGMVANQGRSGIRSANRFQSYLDGEGDDLEVGGRLSGSRLSGPGVPYYRANRRFDHQFKREYRPNENADRSYYDEQQQRNDKYFQALHETDSKKRTQLLRQYNLENLRAARSLSTGRTAGDREGNREAARDRVTPGFDSEDEGGPSASPASRPLESPFLPPTLPSRGRAGRALPSSGTSGSPSPSVSNGARSRRSLPSSGIGRSRSPLRPGASSISPFPSGSLPDDEPRRSPAARRSASDILRDSESIDEVPPSVPIPRRSSAPPPR